MYQCNGNYWVIFKKKCYVFINLSLLTVLQRSVLLDIWPVYEDCWKKPTAKNGYFALRKGDELKQRMIKVAKPHETSYFTLQFLWNLSKVAISSQSELSLLCPLKLITLFCQIILVSNPEVSSGPCCFILDVWQGFECVSETI